MLFVDEIDSKTKRAVHLRDYSLEIAIHSHQIRVETPFDQSNRLSSVALLAPTVTDVNKTARN